MAFEVEFPAAYLDSVEEDSVPAVAGLSPTLINLDPEADERFIARSSNVEFDIATLGATGTIDVNETIVYVDGVVAFNRGEFSSAFNGPNARLSFPRPDVLRLRLDPTTEFGSEAEVTVRVVSRAVGDENGLDTSYRFFIEDYVGPRVVSAEAVDLNRVRVTFNEAIDIDSALYAELWTLDRLGDYVTPIVAAEVVSVEPSVAGGPSAVELVTDIALTPGGAYQIAVTEVLDQNANPILPAFGVTLFEGWTPPKPDGRKWDLYSKFADFNQREDDTLDLFRWVGIIQEVSSLLLYDIDRFVDTFDPDTAPEAMVDAMLADLNNPFDFDLDLTDKRRLANVLVAMYQLKGTNPGIENVIRFFLGIEAKVLPYNTRVDTWALGESELGLSTSLGTKTRRLLYSFDVSVPIVLDDATRRRLTAIVRYMRPGHTHFVTLREPAPPPVDVNHVELGESELGVNWELHGTV